MVLSVKNAGSWATVKDLYVKQGGVWVPVQKAFVRSAGAWVEYYAAEVVAVVSANVNNLIVSTLFSPDDWTSTKKKRVIIQPGVIAGATSTATAALRTGTGRGGLLFIENGGDIRGAGGAANGGAGGPAINVQQAGLTLDNSGFIRGGGGGGGKGGTGGTGGQGYYQTYNQEGPFVDTGAYEWYSSSNYTWAFWGGGYVVHQPGIITSISVGNITYFRGSHVGSRDGNPLYSIFRRIYYNVYTNGGAGGAGGNGGQATGHGQSMAVGSAGANGAGGGTNAGAGGKGGTGGNGGTWGTAGAKAATGNTGAGGNYTGGSAGAAGAAGGAAGAAITGLARTLINTGTIQGAT